MPAQLVANRAILSPRVVRATVNYSLEKRVCAIANLLRQSSTRIWGESTERDAIEREDFGFEVVEIDMDNRGGASIGYEQLPSGSWVRLESVTLLDDAFPDEGDSTPSSLKGEYDGKCNDGDEENASKSKQDKEGKDWNGDAGFEAGWKLCGEKR